MPRLRTRLYGLPLLLGIALPQAHPPLDQREDDEVVTKTSEGAYDERILVTHVGDPRRHTWEFRVSSPSREFLRGRT